MLGNVHITGMHAAETNTALRALHPRLITTTSVAIHRRALEPMNTSHIALGQELTSCSVCASDQAESFTHPRENVLVSNQARLSTK
jgi:hypothetical protein